MAKPSRLQFRVNQVSSMSNVALHISVDRQMPENSTENTLAVFPALF